MAKNKITWDDVYKDFKNRHPRLSKKVLGYFPYGYSTILLVFSDNVRMLYNHDKKRVTKIMQKGEL